ncbi:M24 family metallopeptidase [Ornithinibacillus californiensis]|uniref:M24 family metallopeptidase n=1 Tax=Ornithinibacillus californiensis TaxID=161536 RepID=UPI00064DD36B|nr:Xaa-Pro peptidase family protein [Ornithinibacillus californiensis]
MRETALLEFPLTEYKQRIDNLIRRMKEEQIDAVILTNKENTRYFTGYQLIVWGSGISKPACLIVTSNGDVTMVGGKSNSETLMAYTWVEEIRVWDRLGRNGSKTNFPDAILDVLREKGVHSGRIGMELGTGFRVHLNMMDYKELTESLVDATFVDAAPIIWDIRMIKSHLEIERIRKVCEINIKAFNKGLNSIYPGMTEKELFKEISMAMFDFGADEVFPLGIRAGVDRYSQGNSPPSDRAIQKGEMILVDGGPGYKGYFSDIIREAIIGKPTQRQKELHEFAVKACERGLEAIKPGITCGEVCQIVDSFVDSSGYGNLYVTRGWIGHSIGTSIHEMPNFELGSDLVLQPGMVFAIEPSIYEEGVGMFNLEENILITEDGYELLTPLERELLIL